jgi:tRNA pseudouridine55 synthase
VYEGTAVLGVETTTLDAEGDVVRESPVEVTEPALREAMASFVGRIEQVPPAYSAVKVGGEKLYRAARAGRTVEAAPRSVEVFGFDLISFTSPRFDFTVRCSAGTYVRSLAADVGARLGCGAHLLRLRRTAIGPFSVEEAVSPDDPGPLLPLERAVEHLPLFTLQEEEARAASHGQCLGPTGIAGPFRAVAPDGGLIGIYRDTGAKSCPEVILAPSA